MIVKAVKKKPKMRIPDISVHSSSDILGSDSQEHIKDEEFSDDCRTPS